MCKKSAFLLSGNPIRKTIFQQQPRRSNSEATQSSFDLQQDLRIRIVLADDHPVIRNGLCRVISMQADMEVVGQAADGEEAVKITLGTKPDVVLMDVTMPLLDGIGATRQIVSELPNTCVIGLSMHEDPDIAGEMTSAGAILYLTKSCPAEAVITAIRDCATK